MSNLDIKAWESCDVQLGHQAWESSTKKGNTQKGNLTMCSKNDIETIKNKSVKSIHNITLPLGCVFHHTLRSALHSEAVEELLSGQGWNSELSDSFLEWTEQMLREVGHGDLQLPSLLGLWLIWVLGVELC